jgi:hypothetical protein
MLYAACAEAHVKLAAPPYDKTARRFFTQWLVGFSLPELGDRCARRRRVNITNHREERMTASCGQSSAGRLWFFRFTRPLVSGIYIAPPW